MLSLTNHPLQPAIRSGLLCFLLVLCALLPGCQGSDAQQTLPDKAEHEIPVILREPYVRPANILAALDQPSWWVDSVFSTLTPDERIAQLIIVEAFSDKGPDYEADVMRLIKQYKVGGIIFFQGGPVRQAILTNRYQAASRVPLIISMDAETGIGMRLDSTVQYPFQQMLGAVADNGLIYKMGAQVAAEFKRLGMHVNFAPVADINNNPDNPIISYRSFGENRLDVTAKSLAYMRGMQENDILAVAKHFPGHGDTNVDSHYDLPVIPFDRHRLDSLELYPFKELIAEGVGGIMVAHMHIPQLDSAEHLPASLSRPIITGLLKKELGFTGLVFTDAMVMKGVTKYFEPGEAEARALMAGNDVLERLNSVPKAIQAIRAAIDRGDLTQESIDRRCKRVLAAKQWLGLDKYKPIQLANLYEDLNTDAADSTNTAIAEAALTLLRNKEHLLPVRRRRKVRVATVSFGAVKPTVFQRKIDKAIPNKSFVLKRKAGKKETDKLWKKLQQYDLVLVGLYGPSIRPSNHLGYSEETTALVTKLAKSNKAIIILFDNAYALNQFPGIGQSATLIVAYQPHYHAQAAAAALLFGHIPARGKLPVTVSSQFVYGDGISKDKPLIAGP
ncbi:glycoside hydrolase family 3 C-terminal domain-containing protein [Pontibacter sp. 172403-2]|uniref:glycoside hydrolase family 3 protein n=1 Tax=Pontibacter rufus TaxID=2791028 RepID=UPI0018AFECC4|nr:glycoside hydrolase family 3 N-terminal domain-containing protein [Pontibacter sp. 172403-2]MBF9254262.1 glycoside hydrolase family 3 C-terminal domain-containing protein [Pontibacter sp. 172403-2]